MPAVRLLPARPIVANKQLLLNRRCMSDLQTQTLSAFRLLSRALIELTVLGAYLLPLNGASRAADNPRPLDIRLKANGFGRASSEDITTLLQSAASEIWRHCPRTLLDGIDVYHRADHPQTDFKRLPDGRISIGLATQDTHWAQYSFQFAHEFCHTLVNYSNSSHRPGRYPPHANFWLEESLCETASLFTLRAMSRSWRTTPPIRPGRIMPPGSTPMRSTDSRSRSISCQLERLSWTGSTSINPRCDVIPHYALGTRLLRFNSCPFLKQSPALGRQ
jgi:hypothetical protein